MHKLPLIRKVCPSVVNGTGQRILRNLVLVKDFRKTFYKCYPVLLSCPFLNGQAREFKKNCHFLQFSQFFVVVFFNIERLLYV